MKHSIDTLTILFLIASLFVPNIGFAQEEDETEVIADTTEITLNNRKIIIISDDEGKRVSVEGRDAEEVRREKEERRERDEKYEDREYERKQKRGYSRTKLLAMDIGVTNYYNDGVFGKDAVPADYELRVFRPGSHVALHFVPTEVSLIGRGAVSLKTAITVDFNNYYFENDITLLEGGDSLNVVYTGDSYEKNKLVANYVQLPLMLSFNTRPRSSKGIKLDVGGFVGILYRSRTKQIVDGNKQKEFDRFHLEPIRYGLTARLGFRWFRVYANYNMNSMFEENEGPNTQTFSVGFQLFKF